MADVSLHHAAQRELQMATGWYQQRSAVTGRRFVAEVVRIIAEIGAQPDRFGWYDDQFREATLRRFPYSVVYRVEPDGNVLVIAVAHSSREPGYWQDRT